MGNFMVVSHLSNGYIAKNCSALLWGEIHCKLDSCYSNLGHTDSNLMLLCWGREVGISLFFLQQHSKLVDWYKA